MALTPADILVIDDDEPTREALRGLLEDSGYTVLEAPDGLSALDRLRIHPRPLVALLDWRMPGMDGVQVLRTYAFATDTPPTPTHPPHRHVFLLMTAATVNATHPLPDLPADQDVSVLYKPFTIDELVAQVRAAAARLPCPSIPHRSRTRRERKT